jgi:hypothetical protein
MLERIPCGKPVAASTFAAIASQSGKIEATDI